MVYDDDDNFIKLVPRLDLEHAPDRVRQGAVPVPAGYPRYGNTVVGAARRVDLAADREDEHGGPHTPQGTYGGHERYTAYTSLDGVTWTRGGTWTHHLGSDARIGLVSMGGSGFDAEFDYVTLSGVRR